jgi:hypothetical protein
MYVSGSTCPPTTTSPCPNAASMTTLVRSDVDGSAENMTPDAVGASMRWTTTAIAGSSAMRWAAR